ncbi:hypothetical protein ERO13_A04G058442v2 [Gossypium hirsutum]|nr:hypothetical protein ERO13_A04G058442v2 [Gossypium hirsutum]
MRDRQRRHVRRPEFKTFRLHEEISMVTARISGIQGPLA